MGAIGAGLAQALAAPHNARLGVVDFFEAPLATPLRTSLIDHNLHPAWTPLGLLEAGSGKVDPKVETYQFKSGSPETIKRTYVIGMSGEATMTIREFNVHAIVAAAGGRSPETIFTIGVGVTAQAEGTGGTDPKHDFDVFLSATDEFAVGDQVFLESLDGAAAGAIRDIGFGNDKAISYVKTREVLTATISAAPTTVFKYTVYPKLHLKPKAAQTTAKKVGGFKQIIGGAKTRERSYAMVFNDLNGHQAIVHIHKAQASGGYNPDLGDGKKEATIPVKLDVFGGAGNDVGETALGQEPLLATKFLLMDTNLATGTAASGRVLY